MSNVVPLRRPIAKGRIDPKVQKFFDRLNEMSDAQVHAFRARALTEMKERKGFAEILSAWLEADPVRRRRLSSN